MDRDRGGRRTGLYTANVLTITEWSHRHIAGHGAGVGTHRLEQRRFLGRRQSHYELAQERLRQQKSAA